MVVELRDARPTEAPGTSEASRIETDLLGQVELPRHVYWGIHTHRAVQNFPFTGLKIGDFPVLVNALATTKLAAARANARLGYLSPDKLQAIEHACRTILAGHHHDSLVVDVIQGGAGTSTNMNINEVIANIGLEFMGRAKGDYAALHPNNDVNMAQSTNDAYPTAARLAVNVASETLASQLENLAFAFKTKAVEFVNCIKIGRTQLQDAVPMTLGQEFDAFHATIKEDVERLREAAALFLEVNLGATAIGTGVNTDIRYAGLAVEELSRSSGRPMKLSPDLIEATSDMGAFVLFSGVLRRIAIKISKICNDLRLLSSGPRAGLGEIRLPAVQAGSSIMPGKVNPVIPEALNQIAYYVIGKDLMVTMAAEGGQLQLNAFEPLIVYSILSSIDTLTAGAAVLAERCVCGIEADEQRCRILVEESLVLATALNPVIGYEASSKLSSEALRTGRSIRDVAREQTPLSVEQLDDLLRPERMLRPNLDHQAAGNNRVERQHG